MKSRKPVDFQEWKEENDRTGPLLDEPGNFRTCPQCEAEGDHSLKRDVYWDRSGKHERCGKHRMREARAEKADKHNPPKMKKKKTNALWTAFHTLWHGFHELGVKYEDLQCLRDILIPYFPIMPTNALTIAVNFDLEIAPISAGNSDDQSPAACAERRALLKTWSKIADALLIIGMKRDDIQKCRVILARYLGPIAPLLGYEVNTEHDNSKCSVQSSNSEPHCKWIAEH